MTLRRLRDKKYVRVSSAEALPLYAIALCHPMWLCYPLGLQTRVAAPWTPYRSEEPISLSPFVIHASVPRARRTLRTKCFFHIRHKTIIGGDAHDYNAARARIFLSLSRKRFLNKRKGKASPENKVTLFFVKLQESLVGGLSHTCISKYLTSNYFD